MLKKGAALLSGAAAGVLNGFFGAGGGLVAVPALEKGGLSSVKEAHATALALTACLSVCERAVLSRRRSVFARGGGGLSAGWNSRRGGRGAPLSAAACPAPAAAMGVFMIWFALRTLLR